jgi:hypothetical protein
VDDPPGDGATEPLGDGDGVPPGLAALKVIPRELDRSWINFFVEVAESFKRRRTQFSNAFLIFGTSVAAMGGLGGDL